MKFLKKYWWFLALLLISALLVLQQILNRNSIAAQFSVPDTKNIDGFTIIKGADSISVTKVGDTWKTNIGQEVDAKAVNSLFNVIRNLRTETPVPSKQNDSLVNVLKSKGVKLTVYSKGKQVLSFSALFDTKFKKTVCLQSNSEKAYFVDLVDFTGKIPDLFIAEASYWTGNQIFSIPISKVARIDVDIPQNPKSSYIIGIANGSFELIMKSTNERVSNPNTDRLSRFFSGLSSLVVTMVPSEKQNTLKDELDNTLPMRVITLHSESQTSQISLYPIKVDQINELGVKVEFDPNRFYVLYADNQIAEATYVNFSSVLWDIADLVVKN